MELATIQCIPLARGLAFLGGAVDKAMESK